MLAAAMEVVSLCPLPVAAVLWSTEKRGPSLTVIAKATCALAPGTMPLAPEQLPIYRSDVHFDEDAGKSVYAPNDLAPFKPRVDVTLVGHAYARGGMPTTSLVARLRIGAIDKALRIHGARVREENGEIGPAAELRKLPLRYERSLGGPGSLNPVGTPASGEPDADGARTLPNIEPAGEDARAIPVGFGPIAANWPSRRDRLGRHADGWSHERWYEQPLPSELDLSYFNTAPDDQQLEMLTSDVLLELVNVHPEHARLRTHLARLWPQAYIERTNASPELLTLRCDSVWIDTEAGICTLTWRGQLRLQSLKETGRCLVVVSKAGKTMAWEEVDRLRAQHYLPPWSEPEPDSIAAPFGFSLSKRSGRDDAGCELDVRVAAGSSEAPPPSTDFLSAGDVRSGMPPMSERPDMQSTGHEVTKLLWFDPAALDVIRAAWASVLPEEAQASDQDHEDAMAVLANASASTEDIEASLSVVDGELISPLVATAGELLLSYDELALLRGTVTVATPFAAQNDRLGRLLQDARELLALPWLETSGGTAEELAARIREAFGRLGTTLPTGYLEAQSQRIAIEERRYQTRTLWGKRWIRGAFVPVGARTAIPTYLPHALRDRLPMMQHFAARMVAEVDLREDQYETYPLALRAVALARVDLVS
jgi:hypothetical protein